MQHHNRMYRKLLTPAVLLSAAAAPVLSQGSRKPSAIQRVTGVLSARHAMQRLDSVLAVRVLDARGAELSGARVQWTLATPGAGAALQVINPITDSLGVSRALLTPGRSADAQRAIAEVKDVGRIEFAVVIPAAAIRIVPAHTTLWSGDDAVVAAELRDGGGSVLSGGTVSWVAMDTTVLRVLPQPGATARVRGTGAGSSQLAAWVGDGKVRDLARVTVRATIDGRFMTADGGPVPAVRLVAVSAGARESLVVRDARFAARLSFPLGEAVILHATPADTSYHDAAVRIDDERELEHLVIALVPRTFRIEAGSYEGRVENIDAARAMARVGGTAPFWRLVPLSGTGPRKLLGWREPDLPLRIAFARERSSEPITATDSVAFWDIVQRMERDLGGRFFIPADASADTAARGFIRVEVRPHAAEGHTFVAWAQAGDASEGVLLFRRSSILADPHVVTHELVHLLGFGHSQSWVTVSQPSGGAQRGLTSPDVAYIQLAMRLRRLQETTGARPGLPVAGPAPR
jgi:hypothetical protein